ncbi:MAG: threonine/serine dehydratase [Gammaproteobacteria bacterium]|jgi:threonine dehydratase|nr:threonine/serine dehydratase [Gammaproteobacteria bacterium]
MTETETHIAPTLEEIRPCAERIAPYVRQTPVFHWSGDTVSSRLGKDSEIHLKLELFQRTGTFKARAAINNVLALTEEQRAPGITAMSAGNHAIAAAYAAKCIGVSAKVVMQASANPSRIAAARSLGAELVMAKDGPTGFAMVEEIVKNEGRTFIHPFEGPRVTEATATCGLELIESVADLDAVVVPIGGGGLCSGIATITKLLNPSCTVYGVEPLGAAVMTQSLKAGSAQTISDLNTIADSLAPPMTTPYCFSICQQFLDDVVLVSDDEIAAAASILFDHMKLAVEPAGAVSTAAAFGPLREKLRGKRVALIVCGANIDADGFHQLILRGQNALQNNVLSIN